MTDLSIRLAADVAKETNSLAAEQLAFMLGESGHSTDDREFHSRWMSGSEFYMRKLGWFDRRTPHVDMQALMKMWTDEGYRVRVETNRGPNMRQWRIVASYGHLVQFCPKLRMPAAETMAQA